MGKRRRRGLGASVRAPPVTCLWRQQAARRARGAALAPRGRGARPRPRPRARARPRPRAAPRPAAAARVAHSVTRGRRRARGRAPAAHAPRSSVPAAIVPVDRHSLDLPRYFSTHIFPRLHLMFIIVNFVVNQYACFWFEVGVRQVYDRKTECSKVVNIYMIEPSGRRDAYLVASLSLFR